VKVLVLEQFNHPEKALIKRRIPAPPMANKTSLIFQKRLASLQQERNRTFRKCRRTHPTQTPGKTHPPSTPNIISKKIRSMLSLFFMPFVYHHPDLMRGSLRTSAYPRWVSDSHQQRYSPQSKSTRRLCLLPHRAYTP